MNKLNQLIIRYQNHTFTGDGTTGSVYMAFQKEYKAVLQAICENIDAKLVAFESNHYAFSTFVEKDGEFAYISISDVRHFPNDWFNRVRVQSAKTAKHYTGHSTNYAELELKQLEHKLKQLL